MFAVLVPILVSALGYVTYELVMMGIEEYKEYVAKQEEQEKIRSSGCPNGQLRRIFNGEVSCENMWTACNPPFLPRVPPSGYNWECIPPNKYCPPETTLQIINGNIVCVPNAIQAQFIPPNLVQAQPDPFTTCYGKYMAMGMTHQQALTLCLNRQIQFTPPNLVQAKRKVRVPKKGGKKRVRVPKPKGQPSPSRGGRGGELFIQEEDNFLINSVSFRYLLKYTNLKEEIILWQA